MLPAWTLYQKVRAPAALRIDAGGVAEGAGVGVPYRLFHVLDTDDARHGAEDLLLAVRHLGGAVVEHGGAHEVAVLVARHLDGAAVEQHGRALVEGQPEWRCAGREALAAALVRPTGDAALISSDVARRGRCIPLSHPSVLGPIEVSPVQ